MALYKGPYQYITPNKFINGCHHSDVVLGMEMSLKFDDARIITTRIINSMVDKNVN